MANHSSTLAWKLPWTEEPGELQSLGSQIVRHDRATLLITYFTMQETWIRFLGWEDSLEKEMATHSSILAKKIPWTEKPGAGYRPWGCKESDMRERLHFHFQNAMCHDKKVE